MLKLQNVEMLGNIRTTKKGNFIARYLVTIDGKKHVLTVLANKEDKLPTSGTITITQEIFFAV